MKITKSELKTIIKEEALKFKRAIELKKELAEIEKQLNEVKAGEVMGKDGVHAGQRKAVFASKGNPALKMEDGIEGDDEMTSTDVDGTEVGSEIPSDMASDVTSEVPAEVGETITISKEEVLNAIAQLAKSGLDGGATAGTEAPVGDVPGEEVPAEVGASEEAPKEDGDEEFEFDADEVDEAKPVVKMEATKEATTEPAVKEEETVKENLDEPIEGASPVQDAKENKIGVPFVEKVKNVKEGEEVAEAKETIAEAEKKRMSFLAGIIKG